MLCLVYNQYHYESFVPDTEEDIRKTILLKQQFVNGSYSFRMTDVFGVQEQKIGSMSFAEAVKSVPTGNISSLKQNNRDDLVVTDKDRLNILKSIACTGRNDVYC